MQCLVSPARSTRSTFSYVSSLHIIPLTPALSQWERGVEEAALMVSALLLAPMPGGRGSILTVPELAGGRRWGRDRLLWMRHFHRCQALDDGHDHAGILLSQTCGDRRLLVLLCHIGEAHRHV